MKYDVEKTKLHFIKSESTGTPFINYSGHDELQEYSENYSFQEVEIINARTLPEGKIFGLDKEAFKLATFKPTEVDFLNVDAVKDSYYSDVAALVKKKRAQQMCLFSTTQFVVVLKTLIGTLLIIFITTIRLKQAKVERCLY